MLPERCEGNIICTMVVQGQKSRFNGQKGQILIFIKILQITRENEALNLRFSKDLERLRKKANQIQNFPKLYRCAIPFLYLCGSIPCM